MNMSNSHPDKNSNGYLDILPHNEEEERRLGLQHQAIKKATENALVHVPVDFNRPEQAVLDSGTGSGIWLRELAAVVSPATELLGIDIDPKLFPPRSTLPANLHFQVTSIVTLPFEWTNKFTLIHQSLLRLALTDVEWVQAIANMFRTLKPGGYIQLMELNEWANAGPLFYLMDRMWLEMPLKRGGNLWRPRGSEKLRLIVEEAGFIDIQVKWYEAPIGKWAGRDGADLAEAIVGAMKSARPLILEQGGLGIVDFKDADDYEKVVRDFEMELNEGKTKPKGSYFIICARKPESEDL